MSFNAKALEVGLDAYCPKLQWVAKGPFINTIDNSAFIYALFSSRKAEYVLLAGERLLALMHFANEKGFFPGFLHEYPRNRGVGTSLYVAATMTLILTHFKKIVPPMLRERLTAHIELFTSSVMNEGIMLRPFQKLLFNQIKEGKHDYEGLRPKNQEEWLLLLLWANLSGEQSKVLDVLKEEYIPSLERAKSSLYPLFLEGTKTSRDLFHYLVNYASLKEEVLTQNTSHIIRSALFAPVDMGSCHDPKFYTSVLGTDDERYGVKSGYQQYRFFYSDQGTQYALIIEEGVKPSIDEDSNSVSWKLLEKGFEDREKREIILHINNEAPLQILVNGELSTLFKLGDSVSIISKTKQLDLTFELQAGVGDFIGQIAFGNRVSQTREFEIGNEPTDQIISLRTLRRSGDVTIGMKYQLN